MREKKRGRGREIPRSEKVLLQRGRERRGTLPGEATNKPKHEKAWHTAPSSCLRIVSWTVVTAEGKAMDYEVRLRNLGCVESVCVPRGRVEEAPFIPLYVYSPCTFLSPLLWLVLSPALAREMRTRRDPCSQFGAWSKFRNWAVGLGVWDSLQLAVGLQTQSDFGKGTVVIYSIDPPRRPKERSLRTCRRSSEAQHADQQQRQQDIVAASKTVSFNKGFRRGDGRLERPGR